MTKFNANIVKGEVRKEFGSISGPGCGGFLNPPNHPEHDFCVKGKDFIISLSSAKEYDWLTEETRFKAKTLLDAWEKLPLDHPDTKDWIYHILGYFKGCYRAAESVPEEIAWNADQLHIDNTFLDPVKNADIHAGVHFIRKFYPDYVPVREDFDRAYWGKKPE